MRRLSSLFLRLGSWIGAAALLAGCASRDPSSDYIDDDTAYLRCAVVAPSAPRGETEPVPPKLAVPAGFYVGEMQAAAMLLAGFAQDSTVCLSLQAPTSATLVQAKSTLLHLANAKKNLDERLLGKERCGCEALYLKGLRATSKRCIGQPLDATCFDQLKHQNPFAAPIREFEQKIEASVAPPRHWRMVGRAGAKKGWVRNHPRLLGALRGGSEVFLRRKAVSAGRNQALIQALLQAPGVTAVVRQSGGRALLVVRYLRQGVLVMDYFEHLDDPKVSVGLLNQIDNANIESYLAALKAPEKPQRWSVRNNAKLGWGWQLPALQRLDAAQEVMSYLGAAPYEKSKEIWRHPLALAQSGWVHRQDEEDAWVWSMTLEDVDPAVLGEDLMARKRLEQWSWPRFVPADRRSDFPLRATAWGQGWIYALSSLPPRAVHAAAQQVGTMEADEDGFVYRWDAHELPSKNIAAPAAHAFFSKLRTHAGEWIWKAGQAAGQVQLTFKVQKATRPAPSRPLRGGRTRN